MNAKRIASATLLLFVAVSLIYLVVTETTTSNGRSEGDDANAELTVIGPSEFQTDRDDAATDVKSVAPSASSQGNKFTPRHQVVAYYFHSTQRCKTCLKIERLAEEALREQFPGEFERGLLEWRALNMEEPPNIHFVDDYQLVTSSLVLVDMRDGTPGAWSNLDRVWQLVYDDETAYKQYVIENTRRLLESES